MNMRGRSPTVPAAAAAILLAVATFGALSLEPSARWVCRLPDGSELKLEAVTYGRQHRFVGGRWWRRLLMPLVPSSLQSLLGGAPPVDRTTDSDTIVFWVSRTGPKWPTGSLSRAVVFDENGHELDLGV